MIYYYNKKAVIGQCIANAFCALFIVVCSIFTEDTWVETRNTAIIGVIMMVCVSVSTIPAAKKRYIQMQDEYVFFHSFLTKKQHGLDLKVRYRDIESINVRMIPVYGLASVILKFKSTEHKIVITPYFTNTPALYEALIEKTKHHNPNAYIDHRLVEYVEKKRGQCDV